MNVNYPFKTVWRDLFKHVVIITSLVSFPILNLVLWDMKWIWCFVSLSDELSSEPIISLSVLWGIQIGSQMFLRQRNSLLLSSVSLHMEYSSGSSIGATRRTSLVLSSLIPQAEALVPIPAVSGWNQVSGHMYSFWSRADPRRCNACCHSHYETASIHSSSGRAAFCGSCVRGAT